MIDGKLDNSDVVISSRIRLARNIAEYPFVNTCSDDQRAEIESVIRKGLAHDDQLNQLSFANSGDLDALERQFLLDLHVVSASAAPESVSSSELAPTELPIDRESLVVESTSIGTLPSFDDVSLTVNEEDHLRITVTRNDLDLAAAWNQINLFDDRIEKQLGYAFSPRWGYLTACPANVGTGMRVSVLVHLPALVMAGQIDKVFRSLQRINVVARGVFGDQATGDFFRISNQATLGFSETELIDQVTGVVPSLIDYERQAREFLLNENREEVRREVVEALEKLCRFDLEDDGQDSDQEVMTLLSKVRMGAGMGLLGQDDANRVNRLFTVVHLRHQLLAAVAREDYLQASQLRDRIQRLEKGFWNEGET